MRSPSVRGDIISWFALLVLLILAAAAITACAVLADISTQVQLQPSGTIADAPGVSQPAVPFVVRLRLDEDGDIDVASLPGGTAAIYTDKSRASYVIRRIMIRMQAWMSWVIPWCPCAVSNCE